MKFNLPSILTTAASLVAGVLATLNQLVFHVGSNWYSAITVALVFISALGISPLFGGAWANKFESVLHLPKQFSLAVSAALAAATVAVTTFHFDGTVKSAIVVTLTIFAGLGFAPETGALV